MGWRRLLNEVLVVSPIVLIAGITVQARTRVDSFAPVQYSPLMQRQIAAYVEPVRLIDESLANGARLASPPRVRKVAETWRNMTRQGALVPLHPEHPEDSFREGVKAQIRLAADDLMATLHRIAQQELKEGRPYQAAKDAILAMEAVQGIKYSDLYSIGMFAIRENSLFSVMKSCAGGLTAPQRAEISERLAALTESAIPLAKIVIATQRVTQGESDVAVAIEKADFDLALELAKALDRNEESSRFEELYRELAVHSRVAKNENFMPEFRMAVNASRNVRRDSRALAAILG